AVPTHAAADVQEQRGGELEHRGNLVGQRLGRVKVAGVEAVGDVALLQRVAQVELVRADRVGLGADAEELGLDGVEVVLGVELFGEDLVERVLEALARTGAVEGRVLGRVRYPNIGDGAGAEFFAEMRADAATGLAVANPERADLFVRMRKRAVRGERMRETGRIKIHAVQTDRLAPVHPRGEVARLDGVALDRLSAEVAVDRVQIEAVPTGQQLVNEFEVLTQLVDGAGLAGIVAGGLDAAGERGVGALETADIVALPAVHGDRRGGEGLERGLHIDAERLIGGGGGGKGLRRGGTGGQEGRGGARFLHGGHGRRIGVKPPVYPNGASDGIPPVCQNIQILNATKPIADVAFYLHVSEEEQAWGIRLRGIGRITNAPRAPYPPAGHPDDHAFDWRHGRVLGAWQVVLAIAGEGECEFERGGGVRRVAAGSVIVIVPGQWHRYRPGGGSGWRELWI